VSDQEGMLQKFLVTKHMAEQLARRLQNADWKIFDFSVPDFLQIDDGLFYF
jgi:hypothetical protein